MKSGELLKNLKHTGKRDVSAESKSNTEVEDQQESTIAQIPTDKTASASESLPDPKQDSQVEPALKPTSAQTSDSKPDVVEEPQESLLEDKQTEAMSKSDSSNKFEGVELTVVPVDNKVEDSSAENVAPDLSAGDNS